MSEPRDKDPKKNISPRIAPLILSGPSPQSKQDPTQITCLISDITTNEKIKKLEEKVAKSLQGSSTTEDEHGDYKKREKIKKDQARLKESKEFIERGLPYKFRTLDSCSASSQFNIKHIPKMLEEIKAKNESSDKIVIVDVRSESHIFINGEPVSIYTFKNQANKERTTEQVSNIEQELTACKDSTISIYKTKKYESSKIPDLEKRTEVIVEAAITEEEAVTKYPNVSYKRFPVLDHHAPSAETVDQFLDYLRSFKQEDLATTHFHFHCKGGCGRSTTFMILFKIITHNNQATIEDLNKILMEHGGVDLLKDKKNKCEWRKEATAERKDLVSTFFDYAKDPNGYSSGTSWSRWLESKKISIDMRDRYDEDNEEDSEEKNKKKEKGEKRPK